MKQFLALFLFLALSLGTVHGVEITQVVRDLHYPDIFNYKTHLIGKAKANKFVFFKKDEEKNRPEYFLVRLKCPPVKRGQKVSVVFAYKAEKSAERFEKKETILLKNKFHNVIFPFPRSEVQEHGQVEFWEVQVKIGDEVIDQSSTAGLHFPL